MTYNGRRRESIGQPLNGRIASCLERTNQKTPYNNRFSLPTYTAFATLNFQSLRQNSQNYQVNTTAGNIKSPLTVVYTVIPEITLTIV